MDPISISASCVGLAATIAKTSTAVTCFVRDVRDARRDLDGVSRELSSLKNVLDLLAEDTINEKDQTFPANLKAQIAGILTNCNDVVVDIEDGLSKHEKSKLGRSGYWTMGGGKGEMAKLRSTLEAHKSALEIALEMLSITITRDIKKDTTTTLKDTAAIKDDTALILEEIARLQSRLPADDSSEGKSNLVLQRYLDSLTTYAESVCDTSNDDRPHTPLSNPFSSPTQGDGPMNPFVDDEVPAPVPYPAMSRDASNPMFSNYVSSPSMGAATSPQWMPNGSLVPTQLPFRASSNNGFSSNMPQFMAPSPFIGGHAPANNPAWFYYSSSPNFQQPNFMPQFPTGPNTLSAYYNAQRVQKPPEPDRSLRHRAGFTVENPVNEEMASKLSADEADDSRNYRYTALVGFPDHSSKAAFNLRQRIRRPPRDVDILVVINVPNPSSESVVRTLRSIASDIQNPGTSEPSWQQVVVCIVESHGESSSDNQEPLDNFLHTLMGVRCDKGHCEGVADLQFESAESKWQREIEGPDSGPTPWLPTRSREGAIRAHLFEYTCKLRQSPLGSDRPPQIGPPLQLIYLRQVHDALSGKFATNSRERFVSDIGTMLQARTCMVMEAGNELHRGEMRAHHVDFCGPKARPEKEKVYAGLPTRFYPPKGKEVKMKEGKGKEAKVKEGKTRDSIGRKFGLRGL